jgi:hypothetical protein
MHSEAVRDGVREGGRYHTIVPFASAGLAATSREPSLVLRLCIFVAKRIGAACVIGLQDQKSKIEKHKT